MPPVEIPASARDVGIAAAKEAGAILKTKLSEVRTVNFKGTVDLVTDADKASEAAIVARITGAFPDHRFLGEEGLGGAHIEDNLTGWGWIVDPLDGTTNYAHGYPHFAVSIALEYEGEVQLGLVYDPMRDELFAAERGKGATLNGQPIRVSTEDQLIRSLLSTGFPYNIADRTENSALWNIFLNASQGTRRDGAAALDLSYVAAGRFDGFWERPLQPWDMAAGGLIVLEAGGVAECYDGSPFDPFRREVLASNGKIQGQLREVVDRVLAELTAGVS
jgi:myo-inositol-1(or 4)-monophosphatase